jgi:GNAT superfamily N-acetyltransferase
MSEMMPLPNGYYRLPPGKLANVVTCLEMRAKPDGGALAFPPGYALEPAPRQDLARHRALFAAVGRDVMWFSRLVMADDRLAAILEDPDYLPFVVTHRGRDVGMLDLDFRTPRDCELAFFGLVPEAIGGGVGRALMAAAIAMAFDRPIARFWVHTCTFDHPKALGFYRQSGFQPYAMMVEIHDDPRLSGHLPREASPKVPLFETGAAR